MFSILAKKCFTCTCQSVVCKCFQLESIICCLLNSLPNEKIIDLFKLKAFADEKLKVIQMAKLVLNEAENIVGKEENDGYQHFLLFPQCFQKAFSLGSLKVENVP